LFYISFFWNVFGAYKSSVDFYFTVFESETSSTNLSKWAVPVSVNTSTWSACMSLSSAKPSSGLHTCELLKARRTCELKTHTWHLGDDHTPRSQTFSPEDLTICCQLHLLKMPIPESEPLATVTNPSHEKPMATLHEPSSLSNDSAAADALDIKYLLKCLNYWTITKFNCRTSQQKFINTIHLFLQNTLPPSRIKLKSKVM
jgi:hypothetical protein